MTYLTFRAHYTVHIKNVFNQNVPSTHLLEENTVTLAWYMMLPRFTPFTEAFKEKINRMLSSGLIQRWHANHWRIPKYKKRYVETFQPQVLTVDDLRLGFLAFFIWVAISFFVFLMELGLRRFRS
jgi:hypothetical protein